ncbi:carbohydrate binding domain-containing protein [Rhizobium sp. NPDC090279]|uniref:carbohydrate binding domain-containing protein n=1 Tax=Rhizobium sp. NPDC090279 TaxID=3364499 RepID=UPI00383B536E
MKYLILLLNVLGFWLMADAAHAGPLVAAIGAIAQLLPIGAIGKLFLTVALNIGLSLIEKALAKKDQPQPAGTKLEISMGDDHAMSFIIGSYATAGKRKYAGTWGDDGKTPNAYFTDVIEIGSIPNRAGERGLTSVWIDDQKVGVLWDQPHPDGRGFPVLQYRVKNKDYLWIKFLDGTQTAPDPFLTAKFGTHAERPWKATMIGRGCQVVILTSRYNTDLFKGVPAGLFEPHPLPLYDVRKDSSVGGNGGHRWADPSTWQPSTNPAVMIYNLARGVYYGSEWVYGGQNIGAFCLPATNWMAAANACDTSVQLDGGGSEPAFRAGYDAQCDQEPLDAISELLKGCNGRIAEVGGIFKMLVGTPGGAVYSFTDTDIVVTEEQDFQPFPSLSATYNAIEATYPEPEEKWATKDAPGRYNTDLEVQDGNRRLPAQIQLLAVPFANQVQRVGLAMIQDYRRFRVHQVSLPPDAYPLEPNDVVSWSSVRNGYDEKKFLVVKVEPQPNFLIVVTLKEVDPADYDWHPGLQLPTAIGWLGPITPPSQPMIGWTVEPSTIKDAGGIDRRPAIKISCAPDLDDVTGVWVQVRLKETGDVVFDSDSNPYASPYSWIISGQWMISNTDYEARGRYLPKSNRATDWSAWLAVKTPNVLIQASDVLDGAIIASKIADAAVTASKIMDEAISNLKLANQAVSTAKLQVAAVTADVLASGAVISTKLADGAVTAAKLAQGAVDATALASGIRAVEVVAALPTTGNVEGRQVFLTTDGKLYRYHNGAWTAAVAAGDVNGTLNTTQIADNAITNNKLAALAVDASKIADGSVSAAKLSANAVDATKFASGIRPVEIVSSLPTSGNIEGRAVYLTTDDKLYRYTGTAWTAATAAGDIAGQIVGTQISDSAISTPKLAAGAVTANTLAAGAVTADKIAANSITAGQIAAGAIGATQIAAKAITVDKLLVGSFDNMIDLGFSTGDLSAWITPGKVSYYLEAATSSLQGTWILQGDGRGQALIGNPLVKVSPGESYNFSVWFYNTDPSVNAYIGFWQKDQSGNNVAPGFVTVVSSSAKVWTQMQGNFTVPAGVYGIQPTLAVDKDTANGKYCYWGKPNMRRASGAELIVDGAVTASKVAANAITADKIAANSITARSIVLQDWENLIPDNQMQSSDSWFSRPANTVVNPVATQPFNSKGSLDFTYVKGGGYQLIAQSDPFPVVPEQQYLASAQAIRTSGTKMAVWCRVHWTDATGQVLNPDVYPAIFDTSAGTTVSGLQTYIVTMTPPANAFGAILRIYVQLLNTDGNISFGGFSFLRKASASLIIDGAVTADKIAANAVTAGKIAASAVTAGTIAANAVTAGTIAAGAVSAAQIAAGAITADKLAAGSISTQVLAIGNGGNYLSNSDLSAGLTGWGAEWSPEPASFRFGLRTDTYAPLPGAIEVYQSNGIQGIEYGVQPYDGYGNGQVFAVKANGWYELSAYYLGHRCKGVQPYLAIMDAGGNLINYFQWGVFPATHNTDPQKNLANYQRFWGKAQMPTNAAKVVPFFRMKGTVAGQSDSYLWLACMYFGEANPNQTEPTPWSDGSLTLVSGGNIVANAITADKIAANAITAGKIAANAVTAGTIAAGAVTATTIAGSSITGDKLAANTIGANQIAANAITAKQLVLTDFSNMADNGWQTGTLDGWVTQNQQNFYNDTGASDAAGWVLQSLGRDCARSNFVAVTSGEIYAFDVWVYNTDAALASILAMTQTPSGGVGYSFVAGTNAKNGWARLQGRFTIPNGYTKLAMLLQLDRTAGTGGPCYWSKPVMRRAVSAELIVDGAVTANKISVNSLDAITANLGAVNISSAVIGTLQVGTSNITPGAVTAMNAGRVADVQTIGANQTVNLAAVGINVAGDNRVMINAMTLGQFNQNGGSQNSQPVGCNIFRDGLAIFSQTYYLGVVQTVVSGGGNGGTSQATYTAGLVGVPALYDVPGAGYHVYTLQIYCPGNTIGWRESNIVATAFKR